MSEKLRGRRRRKVGEQVCAEDASERKDVESPNSFGEEPKKKRQRRHRDPVTELPQPQTIARQKQRTGNSEKQPKKRKRKDTIEQHQVSGSEDNYEEEGEALYDQEGTDNDDSYAGDEEDDSEEEKLEGYVVCCAARGEPCECPSCRGGETVKEDFWDRLYLRNARKETYSEYLVSFSTLEPLISSILSDTLAWDLPTLVPGCGDSPFGHLLQKRLNLQHVVCSDISEVCLQVLEAKYEGQRGISFARDDMTDSTFDDETFGVIVDKSLIDCMFWCDDFGESPARLIAATLAEYHRTLVTGGLAVVVTVRDPWEFNPFVDPDVEFSDEDWEDEREAGEIMPPCSWAKKVLAIDVECDEEENIPFEAKMEQCDLKDPSPPGTKRFFVYVLHKLREVDGLPVVCVPHTVYSVVKNMLTALQVEEVSETMQ